MVEAAERSGSLISARFAGELGRLVFAIPGSPLDPRAKGTNALLKNGAILVTETSDILSAISPLLDRPGLDDTAFLAPEADFPAIAQPNETDRDRVITLLGPAPVDVDELIRTSGIHPAAMSLILLELDLAGRLQRHSGGYVSLLYG
ncbi:putative Rossmann fold nucleotide-binding protein DprA/Smf involved in DNA uptake [Phyllobacterium sp. P30BS-XVII]|nr:putative Rossmann fold nucleotide-binding protein DprA/Smf involved in DNA uptake [Phyllobacterium sp. P30BS-XVII]